MMIGKKVTGNTMTSLNGAASGFTLPATLSSLPVGIVVVIGNCQLSITRKQGAPPLCG
jgi:hypothetical protein